MSSYNSAEIKEEDAILPRQLRYIDKLFNSCPLEILKELSKRPESDRGNFYKAIALYAEADPPVYITGYRSPMYAEAAEYAEKEYQSGSLDGLRLLFYTASGLSVKVQTDISRAFDLIKELYERTKDEELVPIIDEWEYRRRCYLVRYENERYYDDCERKAEYWGSSIAGGSHDEAYYEELKRWEEMK